MFENIILGGRDLKSILLVRLARCWYF